MCTHGQRDRCCGCYGYPFYRSAAQFLNQTQPSDAVHLWQISHIGGHRFAPTLIDLPQGRYYGRLDIERFEQLVSQQGDWRSLLDCYRGWSLLSQPLQALEQLFWQNQGWSWLTQKVDYELLQTRAEPLHWQVQFKHQDAEGWVQELRAEIMEDVDSTTQVMSACGSSKTAQVKTYQITIAGGAGRNKVSQKVAVFTPA